MNAHQRRKTKRQLRREFMNEFGETFNTWLSISGMKWELTLRRRGVGRTVTIK